MLLLKFDTLPGTDVITYLAEKSTYSEQMVADIASQVKLFDKPLWVIGRIIGQL